MAAPEGLLVVDKPAGITSHDVVDAARRALGTRKVGHAGTLDPLATGILLLGVGRGTRLLRFLSGLDKEYEGTARLGVETDTLDAEGRVTGRSEVRVSRDEAQAAMAALTGDLMQAPPAYSAAKVGGVTLHRAARRGEVVEAPPRPVRVDAFDLTAWRPPDLDFRVLCSTGTYVRVLVADAGRALGCGAHLTRLVRTRIGPFAVDHARPLDALGEPQPIENMVRHLPSLSLEAEEARAAANGRPLGPAGIEGPYAILGPERRLVAVYRDDGAKAVPEMVLAPDSS